MVGAVRMQDHHIPPLVGPGGKPPGSAGKPLGGIGGNPGPAGPGALAEAREFGLLRSGGAIGKVEPIFPKKE